MPNDTTERREQQFEIHYVTHYKYDAAVFDNMNALRVRPSVGVHQELEEFTIRLTPDARQQRHDDYFGTDVVEFEIARPHDELIIDVRGRVTTRSRSLPAETSWDLVRSRSYQELGGEFLVQTEDAPGHPLLEELDHLIATQATGPLAALHTVAELIPNRFEYRQGATWVDSPITHVLDGGAGVCQDFAHLALNLLRRQGIAARYVSGYLYSAGHHNAAAEAALAGEPAQETLTPKGPDSIEVDTHAWIEALLPVEDGEPRWVAVDPTNGGLADVNHVKIGHGRHYSDIPPIKGVYRGSADSTLTATVRMTKLESSSGSRS